MTARTKRTLIGGAALILVVVALARIVGGRRVGAAGVV